MSSLLKFQWKYGGYSPSRAQTSSSCLVDNKPAEGLEAAGASEKNIGSQPAHPAGWYHSSQAF